MGGKVESFTQLGRGSGGIGSIYKGLTTDRADLSKATSLVVNIVERRNVEP